MHKFAVIHKPSGIVCYSTNREIRNFEPGFNYEIVNNSNEYKTINPDLTFNSYAEIANALDLSDKLTFSKGDDDVLTISDNTRSVSIPSLLFEELRLEVEEVAMGDVEELMEDYSFNSECTELLARNAIKFWVAARFLGTSTTTETPTETPTETTESKEMTEYKTIPPDLNFSDYAEIADALELSDKIVFSTDADDNLTISDSVRNVTIPALLFNESCINIEEFVIGDVYEIVEGYGFSHDHTELLVRQSIKFWVAARFLELSQETNADNAEGEEMTETTTTESKEMRNIFKKATTLPIVISFTHSVSKSREYVGYPSVIAECEELNFKVKNVGWGYDMLGAIVSNLINHDVTQYAIEAVFAFNELKGGYNPVRYIPDLGCFRVDLCTCDIVNFFEDVGLNCELLYKNGKISSVVISSK